MCCPQAADWAALSAARQPVEDVPSPGLCGSVSCRLMCARSEAPSLRAALPVCGRGGCACASQGAPVHSDLLPYLRVTVTRDERGPWVCGKGLGVR